jgi:DNA-directed RNA polymerase specialized sigma subunit
MEAEITKLLPLARHIARDFSNIPGLALPEIEIQAQEALAAAGRQFDPSKGDFTAYASQSVRNAPPQPLREAGSASPSPRISSGSSSTGR